MQVTIYKEEENHEAVLKELSYFYDVPFSFSHLTKLRKNGKNRKKLVGHCYKSVSR